ncbi:MAG: polyhydroxyalkanoate synthesis repressor PhaR [Pseudomonadota bacterium]
MTKHEDPTVIKKYANRRLYNTGTSTYVTLEDLGEMVKNEEDFVVMDAKSGDDITRSVLTQIIFDQENKGQNLLPIAFLRQLIRFYGDSMQSIVPSYLEFSLSSLTKDQEKFREHLSQTFGATAFDAMEDQVRRNTEMFEQAMRMFSPFNSGFPDAGGTPPAAKESSSEGETETDIEALRKQVQAMQKKIDTLANDK